MLGATECRKRAQQKLAQAEREPRHSRKLLHAAQAWLLLANNIEQVQTTLTTEPNAERQTTSQIKACTHKSRLRGSGRV